MTTRKLQRLARRYLAARAAQERDHTDPVLDYRRTEAHDVLMLEMDQQGISYESREEAAEIAQRLVAGTYKRPVELQRLDLSEPPRVMQPRLL